LDHSVFLKRYALYKFTFYLLTYLLIALNFTGHKFVEERASKFESKTWPGYCISRQDLFEFFLFQRVVNAWKCLLVNFSRLNPRALWRV